MDMIRMEDFIITAVYKREALWNPQHILYRNVGVLKKLWQEVCNEVKLDEVEKYWKCENSFCMENADFAITIGEKNVKTKWKNMRAYFLKEYKRVQEQLNSSDGDTRDIRSHWMYYQPLMFLKKTLPLLDYTPLLDESLLTPDLILKEEPAILKEEPAILKEEPAILKEEPPISDPNNLKTENSYEAEQPSPASPACSESSQMSLRKRKMFNIKDEYEEEVQKRKLVESDVSNSDMLFFESLIPYMQDIPITQKLRLRSKIQDLIISELEIAQNNTQY